VPDDIALLCAKANRRLKARFEHLTKDNRLHGNKAKVAIVSELIRWVWAIGLKVQLQQRQALTRQAWGGGEAGGFQAP
jgi:hypothetical protein